MKIPGKVFSKVLASLLAIMVILAMSTTASGKLSSISSFFLPMVYRSLIPTAVFTPMPTAVPTSTPQGPVSPVQVGSSIHFTGLSDIPMSGVVMKSEFKQALIPNYGSTEYPQGVFLVVILDVTNHGLVSDSVSRYSSFRAKDTANRLFDMASLNAQLVANDQYGLKGVYDVIQPGFTTRMVFVYDVLPSSIFTLVPIYPW